MRSYFSQLMKYCLYFLYLIKFMVFGSGDNYNRLGTGMVARIPRISCAPQLCRETSGSVRGTECDTLIHSQCQMY